jgi:predicted dehydrogenase
LGTTTSVAVIGKSGQAEQLISLIGKIDGVDLRYIYHPQEGSSSDNSRSTNNFNHVLSCSSIVIASPTYTHAHYLNLLREYGGYILVEKPAVSTEDDLEKLVSFPSCWTNRLKVNFNLRHSHIANFASQALQNKWLGTPIAFNVHTGHGLAFEEQYRSSWRADMRYSLGVLELVGTHYINLALFLFGPIARFDTKFSWHATDRHNLPPDTVTLNMRMKNNVMVNMLHSYASPYINQLTLTGTNGYMEYRDGICTVYSPRDTHDKNGRFAKPPYVHGVSTTHSITIRHSLRESLLHFFGVARDGGEFSKKDFHEALESMIPVYDMRKQIEEVRSATK